MTRTRRSILRRLDDVLFGPESPARLLTVQAGFMLAIGLRAVLSPYPKLTPAPAALFKPVPFLSFLDKMPPRAVVNVLQVVVALAVVSWFWVARAPRWRHVVRRTAFAVAWLCFLVLAGLRASRGKIFHIELLLVWGSLPLVFAPVDATFDDRRPTRRTGWPIRTAIGVVAACYFMTGIQKIMNSGFDWVFSDNMRWSLAWGRVRGEPPPWRELGVFIADHPWLAQLSAGFILAFELTFALVLVFKRLRPAYVVAAWMFHAGTLLLLGLDYIMWGVTVTILLVDWPPLLDRLQRLVKAPRVAPEGAHG